MIMRKLIFSLALVAMLAGTAYSQPWPKQYVDDISYATSGNKYLDPIYLYMQQTEAKVGGFPAGRIFYVDSSMDDDNGDGATWETAYQVLSTAMTASHSDIATSGNGYCRNVIFVRGGGFSEDFVDYAQKTDIVGVGSSHWQSKPLVTGNWNIPSSVYAMGCHFYNIHFRDDSAGGALFAVDLQGGLQFHNCDFEPLDTDTIAIQLTRTHLDVKINRCNFLRLGGAGFSASAIKIVNSSNAFTTGIQITNNRIFSDGIGIDWDEPTDIFDCWITGNRFRTGGMCIDDESDLVYVLDNQMVCTTYGKAAFDFSIPLASGNMLTTPVRSTPIPYTNECAGAVAAAQRGSFGTIYYVDRNMAATGGDGLTWETACQSLATAMAKSHANIGVAAQRGWAQRNTIYMRGDVMTEDHIVLAQKTDIVGVGSSNYNDRPYVIGTWVIPNTDSWMGCHFYNLYFKDDDGGGVLFSAALQGGLQFHNCTFEAAATDTIGIQLTNTHLDVKIDNCDFVRRAGASFSTAAIQIVDSTNAFTTGISITNNKIYSDGIGIDWNETTDVFDCWITDNFFRTAGMCVDAEDTVGLMVMNNKMLCTGAAVADDASNDFNILWAVNNQVTGNDSSLHIPTYTDD